MIVSRYYRRRKLNVHDRMQVENKETVQHGIKMTTIIGLPVTKVWAYCLHTLCFLEYRDVLPQNIAVLIPITYLLPTFFSTTINALQQIKILD